MTTNSRSHVSILTFFLSIQNGSRGRYAALTRWRTIGQKQLDCLQPVSLSFLYRNNTLLGTRMLMDMKLGWKRREGLGRVDTVACEKRNGLETLLCCLGTSSGVKCNLINQLKSCEKFALCRKQSWKANSLESFDTGISQGDKFILRKVNNASRTTA